MKKLITLALLVAIAFDFSGSKSYAQNLVPNPGFEQYNVCPSSIGLLMGNTPGWGCPLDLATPDYFNSCTASAESGVPANVFGYQWSHRGKGMAGIIAWEANYSNGNYTNNFSEYIQAELLQPLQASKNYCVTFFVSNAIASGPISNNKTYIAVDEVGINFSSTKVHSVADRTLSLPYSVMNTPGRFITDTAGWTKVSTVYKATGTEKYMILGVFTNAGNPPNFVKMDPAATGTLYHSYLYIDDISIEQVNPGDTVKSSFDSTYCNPGVLPMTLKSKRPDGIYKWNNGATDETISINKAGDYWCYTYTDCKWSIDTFHVQYDPSGYLNLPDETVNCNNSAVVLKAGNKFRSYQWSTGAVSDSIVVDKSGTYFVTVDGDCGVQTDTVHVYIQPPTPNPIVNDTVICQYTPAPKLNVKGTNLSWYTSRVGIGSYPTQPPVNTDILGTRVFYVSQISGKCESEHVPVSIYVKYTPKDELLPYALMCERYRDTIGMQLPDVTYRWNTGYNSCCLVPNGEGRFTVSISNECGSYTDTVNVTFSICDTCIKFPNAFTPNRDGKNDEFKPLIVCPVSNYHLSIYNRWGEKVFETTDLSAGWSGRNNSGMLADNGAYVFVADYRSGATGQNKRHQGQVVLLR